ncbi:hypothetical protein [Pseudomonas sp. GZD-222]|uniref:hypothetical protein n=1 Tax=Pseudomonas sp. GZD-222 TaxID=3404805 RepID=UPI003BB74588
MSNYHPLRDINHSVLPAPSVAGVVEGALDPDAVPAGTTVQIPQYADKALGDRITMTWQGLAEASTSDYIVVTVANRDRPINFRIAHTPFIFGNLDREVSVSYQVQPVSGEPVDSEVLNLPIRRKAQDNFVAPTVRQASGGKLDPINATNGATVRVAYAGMLTTDTLAVTWNGSGGADSIVTPEQKGSVAGHVDFTIPISVVAASQDKTITVHYAVVRGANPGVRSDPLALTVTVLGQQHLQAPVVPEANGTDTLDLTSFQGNAAVTVAAWPLIAEGQRYWIKVSGTLVSGAPHSFPVAQNELVSTGEVANGLDKPMLRTELDKLKDLSELKVEVLVAFDGVNNQAGAVAFPVKTYTVKAFEVVVPNIVVIIDDSGTVRNGGTTRSTTVRVAGKAMKDQWVELFDGQESLGALPANSSGTWEIPATGMSRRVHHFTAKGLYGAEPVSEPYTITVI